MLLNKKYHPLVANIKHTSIKGVSSIVQQKPLIYKKAPVLIEVYIKRKKFLRVYICRVVTGRPQGVLSHPPTPYKNSVIFVILTI